MDKKIFSFSKRKIFFGLLVSLFLVQAIPALATSPTPQGAEGSSTPSVSPTSAPTPAPTPTRNPAYENLLIKEGDENDQVIMVQQRLRDLGYYNYKITNYFGSVTKESVMDFQADNKLDRDGVVGGQTAAILFSNTAKRSLGNNRMPTPTPRPTPKPTPKKIVGKLVEWSKAKNFVPWGGGKKFKCMDVYTGKTYYLIRVGGSNHMDVEPATLEDTKIVKSLYGGKWSWDRRPTLARFNGTWYAASINGWPHGKETVKNNGMTGQICLHFLNSRTHGSNMKDADHQRAVMKAAGK